MFCRNCGASMPDDAKFCTSCGASTEGTAPAQSAPACAPSQPNPMIQKFVAALKGFWVKPVATVASAAKSTTMEWVLLAAASILFFALGAAVVGLEMLNQLIASMIPAGTSAMGSAISSQISTAIGNMYPFFGVFGIGLLVGVVAYFATAAGLWVLIAQIFKKNASFISALNMTAVACLPLTAIHLLNMLFGLIWAPLTVFLFIVAVMMTIICLYTGAQKFDKLDKSPFYGFTAVLAIVTLASCLLSLLFFNVVGEGLAQGAMGLAGSALGELGSLIG